MAELLVPVPRLNSSREERALLLQFSPRHDTVNARSLTSAIVKLWLDFRVANSALAARIMWV